MSTIKTNTLQNVAGTLSVPVDTVVKGSAKAWVNFNGTGTVAIRAAFNVSSITDNGTGDYTVNFTTAMMDANYSVVGTGCRSSGTLHASVIINPDVAPTVSAVRIRNLAGTDGVQDALYCHTAVFR